jgi:hypothetical protein
MAHYNVGEAMGDDVPWSPSEIAAAAKWWRDFAADVEPQDSRHVWFERGIAFGPVHPHRDAEYAIDVLVHSSPDADLPVIDYDRDGDGDGHVSVDDRPDPGGRYITVDTTAEEVERAAAGWGALQGQAANRR